MRGGGNQQRKDKQFMFPLKNLFKYHGFRLCTQGL